MHDRRIIAMRKTVILFFLVSVLGVAGLHAQTAVGIRDTVYACDRYVWPVSGHTYTEGRGLTAPVDTVCQGDTCRNRYQQHPNGNSYTQTRTFL